MFAFQDEIEAWLTEDTDGTMDESGRRITRRAWWAAGAAVGLGLGGLAWWQIRERARRLAALEIRGQEMVGQDERGRELWRYRLDRRPEPPGDIYPMERWLRTIDWRGDGRLEAVFNHYVVRGDGVPATELLCISGNGRLRWRWKPTLALLDFDGAPFEAEWSIQDFVATRHEGKETAWVSVTNNLRWSSGICRIDENGRAHLQFANFGYVMHMGVVGDGRDARIVMTGINNAFSQPFVAMISPHDEPSTAPVGGGPRYRYANAPKGTPRLYMLLPNSHFNLALGKPYPIPARLQVRSETASVEIYDPASLGLLYTYEFDHRLRPMKVRASSETLSLHRVYEKQGLMDHPAERCPELSLPHTLRAWTPAEGWTQRSIPLATSLNTE